MGEPVVAGGEARTECGRCGREVLIRVRRGDRPVAEIWDRYHAGGLMQPVRYCVGCGRRWPEVSIERMKELLARAW